MTIQQMQEQRSEKFKAAQEILAIPEMTNDDRAKFDGLMSEVNSLAKDIERRQLAENIEKELRAINFKPEAPIGDKANGEQRTPEQQKELELRTFWKSCLSTENHRVQFNDEEREELQRQAKRSAEFRAVEGTGANVGGELIPPAFQRNLEVALKYYCPFVNFAQVIDTPDGAPMIWPVSSSVLRTAQLVAEGSPVTDADIGTDKVTFGAYKFGDLVKVGLEISQDSFTSVDGIVVDAFAMSFGRGLSSYFTTGSGNSEPQGIVTAAVAGGTVTGDDNATSPDPHSEVGYYDFLTLLHAVDPAYRDLLGAAFMFNDNTLLAAQKLKDKYGRPLWQDGFTSDQPARILGKPYIINNFMDDIGASKVPVIFGDLSRYKVRRVKNMTIQRLVERYAEYGQVGLIAWARYDGRIVNAGMNPIKKLTCPA